VPNVLLLIAKLHAVIITNTVKTGWLFNGRVVTLVADKLKRQGFTLVIETNFIRQLERKLAQIF